MGVILAQVVAKLVADDLHLIRAVDVRAWRIATNRAEAPPVAGCRVGERVDAPRIVREVHASALRGLIGEARPCAGVTRSARGIDGEPAVDRAREPRLL